MRRILLLITGLGVGGAETQVVALAKAMRRRGWEVHVASLTPPGALGEELQSEGIPVASLDLRGRLPHPRSVDRLVRLLRSWRPHVVHAHMFHANLLARLVRTVAPVPLLISTAHGTYEASSRAKGLREITWRERAYRLTDFLCDLTTQISQVGLERYVRVRAAPPRKIRVVPNGVDTSVLAPDPEARRATRAELGLDDQFLWLAVGRIERAKDCPNLLRAFASVVREQCRTTLLIAGEGSQGEEVRAVAGELCLGSRVRFLGVRRDVPRIMNGADGYVMSSSWEGLPMVLLEAHACGLPIVTTAVGGCGEIVKNGETGFVVPSRDPDALARAMVQLMDLSDGERRRMAEGARRRATDQFSLEHIVDRWEAVYAEFLDRNGMKPRRMARRSRRQ